jgi:hypothetical protein
MKKLIIPKFKRTGIVEPTKQDYQNLGFPLPQSIPTLDLPTQDEVREYVGVDLSVGVPLVKTGFFSNKPSILYAPSENDFERFGMRSDFVFNSDGEVERSSYVIKGGTAYVQDPHGSLVESIARCGHTVSKALNKGAIHLRLLNIDSFFSGITLTNPGVKEVKERRGTRVASARYPDYDALTENQPEPKLSGMTSVGLEFALY